MAFIAARASVYAMMTGSLSDDQVDRSPGYVDVANVQSVLKYTPGNINISSTMYNIESPSTGAPGSSVHRTAQASREV